MRQRKHSLGGGTRTQHGTKIFGFEGFLKCFFFFNFSVLKSMPLLHYFGVIKMTKFEVNGKYSGSGLNKFPPPKRNDTLFTFRFYSFKISEEIFQPKVITEGWVSLGTHHSQGLQYLPFLFLAEKILQTQCLVLAVGFGDFALHL